MTLADENTRLVAENATLTARIAELELQLALALARISELEQQRHDPPPFVKPNRLKAAAPKRPRKKRAPAHNHGRRREPPTRSELHALDRCPTCNYHLSGQSLNYTRQVVELPPPQPVEVIEHQVIKRWCPCCKAWRSPTLDLSGQVLGQGRIGVRVIALIAYLVTTLRVPIRRVQAYLRTLHHLTLSAGEISELLHQARRTLQPAIDDLKRQARASPILHGDETSWRENGQNGYIWAFSTPGEEAVRYYEYDQSRGQAVVKRILGGQFKGHLVSDFYCGYNEYAGKKQRCWVHLLRDVHELKQHHATLTDVVAWAEAVGDCYDTAQAWLEHHATATREEREAQYVALVATTHRLGLEYAKNYKHPCCALAKRLLRHEDELFQFVLIEGLSADNNLAERSVRPLVIIRKISGGSRSDEGTKTRMGLASLFETWRARHLNPFEECLKLLSQGAPAPAKTPLPQV
jgi:transposase